MLPYLSIVLRTPCSTTCGSNVALPFLCLADALLDSVWFLMLPYLSSVLRTPCSTVCGFDVVLPFLCLADASSDSVWF